MNLWWTDVVHPTWREVSLTLIFLSFIFLDNRLPTCIVCILRNNILLGEFLTLFILLFLDYLLVDLCIQCLHNKTLFRPISTVWWDYGNKRAQIFLHESEMYAVSLQALKLHIFCAYDHKHTQFLPPSLRVLPEIAQKKQNLRLLQKI